VYAPARRRRIFIIDPADRMNAESQNALLKTLEEPPGSAIVLVASRPTPCCPRCSLFSARVRAPSGHDLAAGWPREVGAEEAARGPLWPRARGPGDDPIWARREGAMRCSGPQALAARRARLELTELTGDILGDDESAMLEAGPRGRAAARRGAGTGDANVLHADVGRIGGSAKSSARPGRPSF
jgi:DNA polymerase-3 subunit delta'